MKDAVEAKRIQILKTGNLPWPLARLHAYAIVEEMHYASQPIIYWLLVG